MAVFVDCTCFPPYFKVIEVFTKDTSYNSTNAEIKQLIRFLFSVNVRMGIDRKFKVTAKTIICGNFRTQREKLT